MILVDLVISARTTPRHTRIATTFFRIASPFLLFTCPSREHAGNAITFNRAIGCYYYYYLGHGIAIQGVPV